MGGGKSRKLWLVKMVGKVESCEGFYCGLVVVVSCHGEVCVCVF